MLALVVILPSALPVDEDPWWQASALIPVFQSFEVWGRETAAAIKDLLLGWV